MFPASTLPLFHVIAQGFVYLELSSEILCLNCFMFIQFFISPQRRDILENYTRQNLRDATGDMKSLPRASENRHPIVPQTSTTAGDPVCFRKYEVQSRKWMFITAIVWTVQSAGRDSTKGGFFPASKWHVTNPICFQRRFSLRSSGHTAFLEKWTSKRAAASAYFSACILYWIAADTAAQLFTLSIGKLLPASSNRSQ